MKIDELERLERAATPGPWGVVTDGKFGKELQVQPPSGVTYICECGWDFPDNRADAEFIAAARNALPALLRVARAAEATAQGIEEGGPLGLIELRAALEAL
jgi:hypothetical protein